MANGVTPRRRCSGYLVRFTYYARRQMFPAMPYLPLFICTAWPPCLRVRTCRMLVAARRERVVIEAIAAPSPLLSPLAASVP